MSVDLPAPFSPSSARMCPARMSRSIASLALTAPKDLLIPSSRTTGDVGDAVHALALRLHVGAERGRRVLHPPPRLDESSSTNMVSTYGSMSSSEEGSTVPEACSLSWKAMTPPNR